MGLIMENIVGIYLIFLLLIKKEQPCILKENIQGCSFIFQLNLPYHKDHFVYYIQT